MKNSVAGYKYCYKCGIFYPRTSDYFCSNQSRYDRLSSECRRCNKEFRKLYIYENNPNIKRVCVKCKSEYPATQIYFNLSDNKKYGVDSICRWCKRDYNLPRLSIIRERSSKFYYTHREERLFARKLHSEKFKARESANNTKYGIRRRNAWVL
jgi:hypothetical protein